MPSSEAKGHSTLTPAEASVGFGAIHVVSHIQLQWIHWPDGDHQEESYVFPNIVFRTKHIFHTSDKILEQALWFNTYSEIEVFF